MYGIHRLACAPAPSEWPNQELLEHVAPQPLCRAEIAFPPASVLTAPVATSTLRSALLHESKTMTLPRSSGATPVGHANCADPAAPLTKPYVPLPASVVMTCVPTSMARTLLPHVSAT